MYNKICVMLILSLLKKWHGLTVPGRYSPVTRLHAMGSPSHCTCSWTGMKRFWTNINFEMPITNAESLKKLARHILRSN